ncbi:Putative motility protein [Thalassobacillus cyri]|uniref:Putative motility protein n=1 Tax=Thalassobacillus cyri TaxID=571932 RepID=A0A1H4D6Z6_9BACI|nr:YjfB family protein [Thalassobacillus cyri]SEA68407.1 Putative motility protein [Thalassobacillus cyri]
MDVATVSVLMSQHYVKQNASLAVMDKSMDQAKEQGSQMIEMLKTNMPEAQHPKLGGRIDLKG